MFHHSSSLQPWQIRRKCSFLSHSCYMHSRWNMHTLVHAHTHTASVTDLLSSRWQFHTWRRCVKPSPADIFSRWKYFFNQMCLIVFLRRTSCSLISTQTALDVLSSVELGFLAAVLCSGLTTTVHLQCQSLQPTLAILIIIIVLRGWTVILFILLWFGFSCHI